MNTKDIISGASNLKSGENPPFAADDFRKQHPQFFREEKVRRKIVYAPIIPQDLLDAYIRMAHGTLKKSRLHENWEVCMGLFVAHLTALHLQSVEAGKQRASQSGQMKGLVSSKSVDGVSIQYDYSHVTQGQEDWGGWNATAYGIQLVTLAKSSMIPGMYIH